MVAPSGGVIRGRPIEAGGRRRIASSTCAEVFQVLDLVVPCGGILVTKNTV